VHPDLKIMKPLVKDLLPPTIGGELTPSLDAYTRVQLGRQLQALYEPVLDEVLDPRLAELLLQLESNRDRTQAG
jgi:DNA-binding protein Fis